MILDALFEVLGFANISLRPDCFAFSGQDVESRFVQSLLLVEVREIRPRNDEHLAGLVADERILCPVRSAVYQICCDCFTHDSEVFL